MLSVAEGQALVLQYARPLPAEAVPTSAALGLVLAEDVASDLDMPPYDKAMMDGYAVRSSDLTAGGGTLTIVEEITAGKTPERVIGRNETARIMTGAPLPAGADAVIPIERTRDLQGNRVVIEDPPARPGYNILYRGREMRTGDTVLAAGTLLRPQALGVLATVGRTSVKIHPAPKVAILATGDELVEAGMAPGPGQIRNGNGPMLAAQVSRAGGLPCYLGIARDRREEMQCLIAEGLQAPVLVLSGGVSAGKLDLVPEVLRDLGVEAHFHKVEMKPGKPVFFGSRGGSLVFGLPGNPVSSLVCFELFVRPALRRLMGHADAGTALLPMVLAEDFAYRTDRPTYFPAKVEATTEGWCVRPVPWFGSADLRALALSNGFILFPAGDHQHRAGQVLPVLMCE